MFRSHHRVESTKGVADLPQIRTGLWSSADDHLPGAFKSAQRVDTGRTGQLCPSKIETRDGQVILVADESCYLMKPHLHNVNFAIPFHK